MFDFIADNLDKIIPVLLLIPVIAFGVVVVITPSGFVLTKTVAPLIHPWPSADSARLPNEHMKDFAMSTIINAAGILVNFGAATAIWTPMLSAYCDRVEGGTEQDRFNAYCLAHMRMYGMPFEMDGDDPMWVRA